MSRAGSLVVERFAAPGGGGVLVSVAAVAAVSGSPGDGEPVEVSRVPGAVLSVVGRIHSRRRASSVAAAVAPVEAPAVVVLVSGAVSVVIVSLSVFSGSRSRSGHKRTALMSLMGYRTKLCPQ